MPPRTSIVMMWILLLAPGVVCADWQYTRWGVRAEEIAAASNGAARALSSAEQPGQSGATFTGLAVGTFATGPFQFDVSFRARKGEETLDTVRLFLKDPEQYTELSNALSARYGKGELIEDKNEPMVGKGRSKLTKTRWHSDTDTIILQFLHVEAFGEVLMKGVDIDYSKKLSNVDL